MWIFHRKSSQHNRIDDAENRGVGADAEREREDGCGSESLVGRESAQRIAHVLREVVPKSPSPDAAALLAQQRGVAELALCQSFRTFLRGAQIQMQAHLFRQIVFPLLAAKQLPHPTPEFVEPFHWSTSSRRLQNSLDCAVHSLELRQLSLQLLAPRGSKPVIARAPVPGRYSPLSRHPAFQQHSL